MREFEEVTLLEMLLSDPSLYLREVQQKLETITGAYYDSSTICRAIKRTISNQWLHSEKNFMYSLVVNLSTIVTNLILAITREQNVYGFEMTPI